MEALGFFDRAAEAAPERLEVLRGVARFSEEHGSMMGAEDRWEAVLREFPWDVEAARSLLRLRRSGDRHDEATEDLVGRIRRFGSDHETDELLEGVPGSARGEGAAPPANARIIDPAASRI
jgi:hypothetical protein